MRNSDKGGILGMIESLAPPDFEQNDVSRTNRSLKISGRNVMAPNIFMHKYVYAILGMMKSLNFPEFKPNDVSRTKRSRMKNHRTERSGTSKIIFMYMSTYTNARFSSQDFPVKNV